jgi:hypothetical protein
LNNDQQPVPSSTPPTASDMDPNDVPDIAPIITHHGVLNVAEEKSKLEALESSQELPMQQRKKICRVEGCQYPSNYPGGETCPKSDHGLQ